MTESAPCLHGESGGLRVTEEKDERSSSLGPGAAELPNKKGGAEEGGASQSSSDAAELECPVCTEAYDGAEHRRKLLHCRHALCEQCARSVLQHTGQAEVGRLSCPLCRQKTPVLQWEIRRLQELMLERDCLQPAQPLLSPAPGLSPEQRPPPSGLIGCLPCLLRGLRVLERQNRPCYRLSLGLVFCLERLCPLFLFVPILLLVVFLLFVK